MQYTISEAYQILLHDKNIKSGMLEEISKMAKLTSVTVWRVLTRGEGGPKTKLKVVKAANRVIKKYDLDFK